MQLEKEDIMKCHISLQKEPVISTSFQQIFAAESNCGGAKTLHKGLK